MDVAVCLRRALHGNHLSSLWTSTSSLPFHTSRIELTKSLSIWHLFSTCHVRSDLAKAAVATQQDEAAQPHQRAGHFQTWWTKCCKLDPKLLTKKRQRSRTYLPQYEGSLDMVRHWQAQREAIALLRQTKPAHRLRLRMQDVVSKHAWIREELPWKTHIPILYPEKVDHKCSKCVVTRHSGFKMWWKRKPRPDQDDNELYECHKCYFTGPEAMPEGFEDVETQKALRKRKIELDGFDPVPQRERKVGRPR